MIGKKAKILSNIQIHQLISYVSTRRHPVRNRVIALLSVRAGLRAGEIAQLTWPMVLDPSGAVGPAIELRDHAAKKQSGRLIPLHADLRLALSDLRATSSAVGPVVRSERGGPMTPVSIVNWFALGYQALGFDGCSSRQFNPKFTKSFPRFVQKSIWNYCAMQGMNVCNGNKINDAARCDNTVCRLFASCDRHSLY